MTFFKSNYQFIYFEGEISKLINEENDCLDSIGFDKDTTYN